MIFYRHRVYQEKPKGFSQSHAAVWSRSLCAEPLGSSCHLPILSQSENSVSSVSSVLKNIRLLLLLLIVDLRHERVGVLADIVLGQHLRLPALLRLRLALGILLFTDGCVGLLLSGGALLLGQLLPCALQTDGGLNVGGTELIAFPSRQPAESPSWFS